MIKCENRTVTCKGKGSELLEDLGCIEKAVANTVSECNISERQANTVVLSLVYSALNGGVKKAGGQR